MLAWGRGAIPGLHHAKGGIAAIDGALDVVATDIKVLSGRHFFDLFGYATSDDAPMGIYSVGLWASRYPCKC